MTPSDDHTSALDVRQDTDRDRFELLDTEAGNTSIGVADYRDDSGRRIFFHTKVEDPKGRKGLGAVLVGAALDRTREEGLRAVPVCSYVAHFLDTHEEYADLAASVTDEDRAVVDR